MKTISLPLPWDERDDFFSRGAFADEHDRLLQAIREARALEFAKEQAEPKPLRRKITLE